MFINNLSIFQILLIFCKSQQDLQLFLFRISSNLKKGGIRQKFWGPLATTSRFFVESITDSPDFRIFIFMFWANSDKYMIIII